MLRMSKLTDYGIVIMSYLAKTPQQMQSATEIAVNVGVALPTVSKILKILTREGFLTSQRGLKGGYSLAFSADEISIADLVDALEGPIALTECSYAKGMCQQERSCSVRQNWLRINQVIHDTLDGIRLAQMNGTISASSLR
ncbi:MAG: SUF system Fe-S cluster assembly regulator [Gammaproteobacteria bacterium]|nr:SUF system Fe-S cluster assembly regulator [Gammaproteobacteria bacterium]